ncbi:MAG TPA: dihydroxy-acid dehydratase [Solirubrobacter sp.]|nr:dihydroxy-acid dehydratase [Solirubrobacter sp.]
MRSTRWYGVDDLRAFGHRSRTFQMGYDRADFEGKPVIAVVNTWSEINPCHTHLRSRAEDVKRGVWQAGGFPVEVPALSLSEPFMKPTTMLYRNLLALETEELLRSYPFDGAVLLGGCDKTTPGLVMGALSAELPFVFVPCGPMLRARWRGAVVGSGSDVWRAWDERRAGALSDAEWSSLEERIASTPGHCMTMGTASTMTSAVEALGLTLPGAASIPAADAAHPRMAVAAGRLAVSLPRVTLTRAAFLNAARVVLALGGSTNAVIHLVAMAGRAGVAFGLDDFSRLDVPVLANVRPSGKYLMQDFFEAGGLRGLMARLALEPIDTVVGPLSLEDAPVWDEDVIRPLSDPVAACGLAVLRGSLAPDGCVIKPSAASLRRHTGPAVVFDGYSDLAARIDDPALAVDASSVLVLRGAGPLGGPGMPEWGMLPIPRKLLRAGVRDMVRVSDARMSGTAYGTCVLHVAPEAFVGGPLALVESGDLVSLDVDAGRLDLLVPEAELAARRSVWVPPVFPASRGYVQLFARHVTQADRGCDFDFLEGAGGVGEPAIH